MVEWHGFKGKKSKRFKPLGKTWKKPSQIHGEKPTNSQCSLQPTNSGTAENWVIRLAVSETTGEPILQTITILCLKNHWSNTVTDVSADSAHLKSKTVIFVSYWYGGFLKVGVPQNAWFIMEHPSITGWWLGVAPWLRKPPCHYCSNRYRKPPFFTPGFNSP